MAHAVIRTDLMRGTDVGADLVSLRYVTGDNAAPTAIDNGMVVKIGALESGEREVRVATTPAANTPLAEIAVVASEEVLYDERKKNLDDFTNEAGKIARGYKVNGGHNVWAVTAEALSAAATPAVGNIVELQADTKLKVVATATSGSTTVGKIIAIENVGRYTYYVIEVA